MDSLNSVDYTADNIKIFLENYRKIENSQRFTYIMMDLNNALCSDQLTGDQRRVLFVHYALELNVFQSINLLNMSYKTYKNTIDSALLLLAQGCQNYQNHCEDVLSKQSFDCLLEALDYSTVNVFNLECTDILQVLLSIDDTLAFNAIGIKEDTREYTDDTSKYSKHIYKVKERGKKNVTEDEFYGQDLKKNVFYGDESLLIAELDRLGSAYNKKIL